ncbi:MAG: hypothetical protein B7Z73_17115, partial [Planctomycetia bacterium 21-64-5]
MNLRRAHHRLRFGIFLAACCAVGCASAGPKPARKWYDPFGLFHKDEKEGPQYKVITSTERVKILRDLAKKAKALPPPEQERATDELSQALPKEQDILVRAEMLRTIALFPGPRVEAMLKAGMRDADQDVRIACCDAWGTHGGSEANHVLCETLTGDTDRDVRMAAARGLAIMKDPQSVGPLVLALDDPDPAIQFRAMQSLKAITGKKYESVKEWRD